MKLFTFDSQHLDVDWISFNIQGLTDPKTIASNLSKYFTSHILMDDVPSIGFHGLKKKYKVSIRQYTGFKGYWVGTKIIFSGKNAAYFYKLVKTQRFDWNLLKLKNVSLGLINLHYFRQSEARDLNQEVENFMKKSCQMIWAKSKRIQAS